MDWVSANRGEIYQTLGSNERGTLEVNSTIKEESLQMSTLMFKHNISASPPLPGVCVFVQSFQSGPTLCNPRDYSPPGCCVHGILQARTLECIAISFSITRGLSRKKKISSEKEIPRIPWWYSWLGLHASNAGYTGSILGQGTNLSHAT